MTELINKDLAKILWNNKEYFSKGKRGLIYLTAYEEKYKEKKFVIKVKNPESFAFRTIEKEYENNKLLNTVNVGPEVFWFDEENDFMIREFIEGVSFYDWVKNADKNKIKFFFVDLLNQCRRMDVININKLEINHPHKDLLVVNDLPVIIDFERCKFSLKPKNVTQVCQFFVSTNVKNLLKDNNVFLDSEKIISLAEIYKKSLSDSDFNKIKDCLVSYF